MSAIPAESRRPRRATSLVDALADLVVARRLAGWEGEWLLQLADGDTAAAVTDAQRQACHGGGPCQLAEERFRAVYEALGRRCGRVA